MRYAAAVLVAGLAALPAAAPARAYSAVPAGCGAGTVLLLGSYPAEVEHNLDAMALDAAQPTTLQGHDFYAGTLDGHRVVTAIAGPSPALATSVTLLGLDHFACVTAVVYSGTAGGEAPADLGDVAVPSRWTGDEGRTWTAVDAQALALARTVAPKAAAELGSLAAVNDGDCSCDPATQAVPLGRTPTVVVGGDGVTYGGDSDTCTDGGGELGGCNPCPPCPASTSPLTTLPLTPLEAANVVGSLIKVPDTTFGHANVVGNSSLPYLADDQQTTGAQAAATQRGVPFLAFRGISDTEAVGDAWPAEYAVYQGLAADNSATAARVWIDAWAQRSMTEPAAPQQISPPRGTRRSAAPKPRRSAAASAPAGASAAGGTLAYTGLPEALPWAALALAGSAAAVRRLRRRAG